MRFLQDMRWLDVAIKGVAGVLILAVLYLGYSVTMFQLQERRTEPASRAVANLIAAVQESPDDVALRLLLGDALAAAGRFREAVEQYSAALELSPNNPSALSGLALVAMYQQDWELAEEYWLTVIDELGGSEYSMLDQRLEIALYQLGVTYIELARHEDAIAHLTEAIRIRRGAADTHYALSVAYGALELTVSQKGYLENALMFDPSMPEANYDYGLLLLAEGDVAGAAEYFRISVDNAPGRREPQDELARIERERDADERLAIALEVQDSEPERAMSEARIAVALDPLNIEAARLAALLYEASGNDDAAVDAWRKVLDIDPNDPAAAEAVDRVRE